jgi:hypothetical protein
MGILGRTPLGTGGETLSIHRQQIKKHRHYGRLAQENSLGEPLSPRHVDISVDTHNVLQA